MRCAVRFLIPGLYNKVVSSPYPDTLQPRQSRLQRPQTQFPLLNLRYTGFAGPIQSFSPTIPSPSQQGRSAFGFSFPIPHYPDRAETLLEAATVVRLVKLYAPPPPHRGNVIHKQGIAEALGRERRKTRVDEYLGEISQQAQLSFHALCCAMMHRDGKDLAVRKRGVQL